MISHSARGVAALAAESSPAQSLRETQRVLRALTVLGGLLMILTVLQVSWSIAAILQPRELMYGEAIVYDHAARIRRGEPLYQPLERPPYTVAAYTPLFYALAAGLQATFGPGFGPGRVLSVVAGLVVTGCVAILAARRASSRTAGALAALLFAALGLSGIPPWSALYKVDLVGVALSVVTVTLLSRNITTRNLIVCGVLAGLAILTKQTFFAAAVTGFGWLWFHDRRKAVVFAAPCVMVVLASVIVLELTTEAFLANVVFANINPLSSEVLIANLTTMVQFQAGSIALAVIFASERIRAPREADDELLLCYWLASAIPLIGLAKVGSNLNYWLEFAAITAVLGSLGAWSVVGIPRAGPSRRRAVTMLALCGLVFAAAAHVVAGVFAIDRYHQLWPTQDRVEPFAQLIERVRTEPREVLADPLDVVVLAGRPILLEPYLFAILAGEGLWDPSPLVRQICADGVGLLVVSHQLGGEGQMYHSYPHWPTAILTALRQAMVLELEYGGRSIYVPRHVTSGVACGPHGP